MPSFIAVLCLLSSDFGPLISNPRLAVSPHPRVIPLCLVLSLPRRSFSEGGYLLPSSITACCHLLSSSLCPVYTTDYGRLTLAWIFHELLSRDHEDGRATGQPQGVGSEVYLNGTSKEPTPEDARKDGHIRGRSKGFM